MTPIEEQYIPEREPWLSEWCTLHSLHLEAIALAEANIDTPAERWPLRAAVKLADAKYVLYLASIGDAWARRKLAVV